MKTITIDFDTYQAELAIAEEVKEDMYDKGSKACENRYKTLIEYLKECLKDKTEMSHSIVTILLENIL